MCMNIFTYENNGVNAKMPHQEEKENVIRLYDAKAESLLETNATSIVQL